jgi:hypothetical protein
MLAQLICHPWIAASFNHYVPSLVIKDMNSETHSCMHSFASLAILAFSGRADFMIRATGAKFCMLASVCKCALSALLNALDDERCAGGDEDDCGEDEGIAIRASHHPVARVEGCGWLAFRGASHSTKTGKTRCEHCRRYMSVAKARARQCHSSEPFQVLKGRLGAQDVPIDREGPGNSQLICEQGTQGTIGSHARVARHNTRLGQASGWEDLCDVWDEREEMEGYCTHHSLWVAIGLAP